MSETQYNRQIFQQLFQQMPLFFFKRKDFFQNSTDFYQNSTLPANLLRAFAEFRRKMKPVLIPNRRTVCSTEKNII